MKRIALAMTLALALAGTAMAQDNNDNTWPCRQPGWEPGDHWGPGPLDVVPDVPLCEGTTPIPTLPPTDTDG